LESWCNENDLHLNLDKCSVMSVSNRQDRNIIKVDYRYGHSDRPFKRVTEQKDLGVIVDSKLNFGNHINFITSKAYSTLGFIKRFCYDVRDVQSLKTLYYTFVQSILEYCCVVWLPYDHTWINRIESVQKQFTMFALREYPTAENGYHIASYDDRMARLEMYKLERRRLNTALVTFYDLVNGNIHCPNLKDAVIINSNPLNLRETSVRKFKLKSTAIQQIDKAPINQMCKLANIVNDLFVEATSRTNFKSLVRDTNLLNERLKNYSNR